MELGLGFDGGIAAFLTFALVYGLDLDELVNAALPNIPRDVTRRPPRFAECKAPCVDQLREHERLRALGFSVVVLDSKDLSEVLSLTA